MQGLLVFVLLFGVTQGHPFPHVVAGEREARFFEPGGLLDQIRSSVSDLKKEFSPGQGGIGNQMFGGRGGLNGGGINNGLGGPMGGNGINGINDLNGIGSGGLSQGGIAGNGFNGADAGITGNVFNSGDGTTQ